MPTKVELRKPCPQPPGPKPTPNLLASQKILETQKPADAEALIALTTHIDRPSVYKDEPTKNPETTALDPKPPKALNPKPVKP